MKSLVYVPWCFLHNFLVSPLNGALSFIQPQGITMFICQKLKQQHIAIKQMYAYGL